MTVRVSEEVRAYLPGEPRLANDGSVTVSFDHLGAAYRELLRFGTDVEVLEPAELRARISDTSRAVAAMYDA